MSQCCLVHELAVRVQLSGLSLAIRLQQRSENELGLRVELLDSSLGLLLGLSLAHRWERRRCLRVTC